MKWSAEAVVQELQKKGFHILSYKAIDHGVQLELAGGTKVNVFTTGKWSVQGKAGEERSLVEQLLSEGTPAPPPTNGASLARPSTGQMPVHGATPMATVRNPKEVFIVYGHDTEARKELELLLLRLDIKPIILSNLAPDGKTLIQALMTKKDVPYAIALLTPDDVGHRKDDQAGAKPRARQNVVLELGMFLMKLGTENVAILLKGNIERPSDIEGLIYIPFKDKISEAKNKLAAAMQKAGFQIDIEKLSAE